MNEEKESKECAQNPPNMLWARKDTLSAAHVWNRKRGGTMQSVSFCYFSWHCDTLDEGQDWVGNHVTFKPHPKARTSRTWELMNLWGLMLAKKRERESEINSMLLSCLLKSFLCICAVSAHREVSKAQLVWAHTLFCCELYLFVIKYESFHDSQNPLFSDLR